MNKSWMVIGAVVLGVMVLIGQMVLSADKERLKEPNETHIRHAADAADMAMAAKITIDQAITTGLDNFPGQVFDVELEKKSDKVVWDVAILTSDQGVRVVEIDAESGSVITTGKSRDEESLEREQKQKL
ncbi:PepSY domain-containing protein [Petrachloros mirabilis]